MRVQTYGCIFLFWVPQNFPLLSSWLLQFAFEVVFPVHMSSGRIFDSILGSIIGRQGNFGKSLKFRQELSNL